MESFRFFVPTEIDFEQGALKRLASHCEVHGIHRPFLVTGPRAMRKTGILDEVLALLRHARHFDQVLENPTFALCEEGARHCRAAACDGVVALGGGSVIDAAKAIALLTVNEGGCKDYIGVHRFSQPPLPLIAIPTTAGTGSEVTPYTVLVDEAARQKRTIAGTGLFPKVAILDPELTLSLPRDTTRNTGLDVLSQAMEGIASRKATPITDTLALECIRLVREHLPRVVHEGKDRDARGAMLLAATLSGMVIAHTGTTLVHGMGYYYTLACGVPHGLANALLLRPVFRFNAAVIPHRVEAICNALGHPTEVHEAPAALSSALDAFFDAVDLSPAAKHHGVPRESLTSFARDIAQDPYRFKNQFGELDEAAVLALYEASWNGA